VSDVTPYPRGASVREEGSAAREQAGVSYAGWWRRAAALLIDSILVSVVIAAVIGIAFGVALVFEAVGGILLVLAIVLAIAAPIFYWIYWTGKEPGQTVGKKMVGIRVRNAEQDRAIGYGASAGRYFITFLFGIFYIPALLDYLWPLWDGRNQTLHDKVANSIVVRA
jgi:uncharacterized RDD family membrane protein YckC